MRALYRADSERDIVLHIVELPALLRAGRRFRRRFSLRCGRLARSFTRAARTRARSEHLHHVAADFGAEAVLAGFLVLPLARAQAALDVHLRAFLQVFARDLGKAPEEG